MINFKDFPDGLIYQYEGGLFITLRSTYYADNRKCCIRQVVPWQELYDMPLEQRNMFMLYLLNALYNEYENF